MSLRMKITLVRVRTQVRKVVKRFENKRKSMLLRQGQQVSYDTALEMAANTQAMMHTTADHAEGVAALIEKRDPHFTGK